MLLEVSRHAYYQWSANGASPQRLRGGELGDRIAKIHGESRRTYGALWVHRHLRRDGIGSRKRVARLMAERQLVGRGKRRSKRTMVADPAAQPVATDLVQRAFTPNGAVNRVWVGDITYLRSWEGWRYLATVIDLGSRRVVGFAMADHMRASLATEAN